MFNRCLYTAQLVQIHNKTSNKIYIYRIQSLYKVNLIEKRLYDYQHWISYYGEHCILDNLLVTNTLVKRNTTTRSSTSSYERFQEQIVEINYIIRKSTRGC